MNKEIVLRAELVGLKNLKSTHVWRIELDVYEIDSPKVKQLFDLINRPLSIGMVELDG
jgi:hypothetical protein